MQHPWNLTMEEARDLQKQLAARVVEAGPPGEIRFVAGVDLSGVRAGGDAVAAAVLLAFPSLDLVEVSRALGPLEFPYVAGFLSFREAPLMIEAMRGLRQQPDLILVDGQGRAHPRRLGIASHLGLLLGKPTIGCGKSRLVGEYQEPAAEFGARTSLEHRGEVIGTVLRTKPSAKPLFVSVGHLVSLAAAVDLVLRCTLPGQRLPEPTRRAHVAAGQQD